MCKPRTYVTALLFLTILLPNTMILFAQESQETTRRVVKKEGWLIPGRRDFKHVSQVVDVEFENVTITQRLLEASTEIVVDLDGNRVEPYVRRKSGVRLFSVRKFSVFESNGRVFGYLVSLVPVHIKRGKNNWVVDYDAAMGDFLYVDDDGDGVFESRHSGLPQLYVPEWIRRNV